MQRNPVGHPQLPLVGTGHYLCTRLTAAGLCDTACRPLPAFPTAGDGVHGKEGLSTIKAIKKLSENDVKDGTLVLYNCDQSKYISTLNPLYYQSTVGKEILYLINHYQPDMYIELHCYKPESYPTLTSIDRIQRMVFPPS